MINEQILLTDLPEEVYFSFRDYLTQDDYQQLLNTSKVSFLEIRRKSIIYHLTEKYSIRYCEDENYRNQLIEKVENPFKQIRIKLLASVMKHYEYLFDLVPIHLILKSQFQENPYISRHVKELILDSYFLDTPLVNVSQCEKVTFKDCHITDISLLKDCEHITLHFCRNVTDFSSLGKQRTLLIELTHHLTNVMNLHSIRTLILKHCSDLVDISPLRGVYDLSLIRCSQVTDISSLGGHHRLEIRFIMLQKLSGYHALKDIPVVNLCKCNISDASVLSNAKVVYLQDCEDLVDVTPLKGVKDLTLRDCSNVRDISPLRAVKKLTLIHLTNLKKYEGINQMIDLSLEVNNSSYSMVKLFPNAKSIKFSYIEFRYPQIIQRLQSFTNLHSLTFCGCTPMKIEVNIDIHTVIIEHCLLESISGLGKSHVVRLINCRGEVDVSSLVTVAFVSIIQCQFKNVNYESLKNVSRLKITDFRRIPFQENL